MGIETSDSPVTVCWVDPYDSAEYAQVPERMRGFRTLDEASSFVLLDLAPIFRQDVRILTQDRTLEYSDIAETHGVAMARLARQHFGPGNREMRQFDDAVRAVALAK